jgi:hypothetical protein
MNERDNAFQPITPGKIENAVAFLQEIESLPSDQISKPGRDPFDVDYDPIVWNLMRTFEQNGFVQPYDWGKWQPQAERIFQDPKLLEQADLDTCIKLITLHVRKDRFCSGHFGAMVRCGHIAAILRRLDMLRKTLS